MGLAAVCISGLGSGVGLRCFPNVRHRGEKAHHALVARVGLSAGVAAAVPVPVAIFNCGAQMGAP